MTSVSDGPDLLAQSPPVQTSIPMSGTLQGTMDAWHAVITEPGTFTFALVISGDPAFMTKAPLERKM